MPGELTDIIALSLRVTGLALLISSLIGIPLGALAGLRRFIGRRLLMLILYTGMGFPPVVVGLFVYLLLSRNGWLAGLPPDLLPRLFTPAAMVFAQTILSLPLVAGLTAAAVMAVDPNLRLQVRALGASEVQAAATILGEARAGVLVAIIAGFGSIISEVGAVMMVGGNIAGHTRVLTTAIVLETSKGNFDLALALGGVLLGLSFLANFALLTLQGKTLDP